MTTEAFVVFLTPSRKCGDGKPYVVVNFDRFLSLQLLFINVPNGSPDSVGGTVIRARAERPMNRGSIPSMGQAFISTPQHPVRHWDPLNLLFRGYGGIFPRDKADAACC
jgi:hypothetical protein